MLARVTSQKPRRPQFFTPKHGSWLNLVEGRSKEQQLIE
jgi:hypothetical protein